MIGTTGRGTSDSSSAALPIGRDLLVAVMGGSQPVS
jgi:hypothetical protein